MRLRKLALLLCLFVPLTVATAARADETPTEHAANVAAQQEMSAAPVHGNLPDYSLSPDQLAKANIVSAHRVRMHFIEAFWGIAQLALLLWLGGIGWIRDRSVGLGRFSFLQWITVIYRLLVLALLLDLIPLVVYSAVTKNHHLPAAVGIAIRIALFATAVIIVWKWRGAAMRASAPRWVEGFAFLILFTVAGFLLDLPFTLYNHHFAMAYGLSVQHWPSFFGDEAKTFLLTALFGGWLVMLLFWVIRKFPRTWWLVFWFAAIPIMLAGTFVTPYVIDPLFNKFEPLQKTNPDLVVQLEKVVARGNMNIPPERMFLMKASEKVTTMNAYVTGFGASKRVVVWDTSLQKATPDEVLFVFGHESGHYVLNHIVSGLFYAAITILVLLYLGYHFIGWSLRRFGATWRIPSQDDFGALAVLILAFSLAGFFMEPAQNAWSRSHEHAADVYGQEAIHGIVANPADAAKGAFRVLAENSLDEPNTPAWVEFWMYNHPSTGRRAAFAAHYDPWSPHEEPKYFKK